MRTEVKTSVSVLVLEVELKLSTDCSDTTVWTLLTLLNSRVSQH
jgi:hypothetical protein